MAALLEGGIHTSPRPIRKVEQLVAVAQIAASVAASADALAFAKPARLEFACTQQLEGTV
jgi:hypothetical protein